MVNDATAHDGSEQATAGRTWGPGLVDNALREAICHCWLAMPPDKKTVHDVEIEIRRLVERALKDLREDSRAFGISS